MQRKVHISDVVIILLYQDYKCMTETPSVLPLLQTIRGLQTVIRPRTVLAADVPHCSFTHSHRETMCMNRYGTAIFPYIYFEENIYSLNVGARNVLKQTNKFCKCSTFIACLKCIIFLSHIYIINVPYLSHV